MRLNKLTLRGFRTAGGAVELSQLNLYDGATKLDLTGLVSTTVDPATGALDNLLDGTFSTTCAWPTEVSSSNTFAITVTFPTVTNVSSCELSGPAAATYPTEFISRIDGTFCNAFRLIPYPGATTLQSFQAATPNDYEFVTLGVLGGLGIGREASIYTVSANGTIPVVADALSPTGTAMVFASTGLYYSVYSDAGSATYPKVNFGSGDFYMESAFKSTETKETVLIDGYTSMGNNSWQLSFKAGVASFYHNSATLLTGTTAVNDGNWHTVTLCKVAGSLYLFTDGNLEASSTATTTLTTALRVAFGAQVNTRNTSYDFVGSMAYAMIVGLRDVGFYPVRTASFPKQLTYSATKIPMAIGRVAALPPLAYTVAVNGRSPLPYLTQCCEYPLSIVNDFYQGLGRISGTVAVSGTPNVPVSRRVRLFRSVDGKLIRETFSTAAGDYEFAGIPLGFEYDVIAWDNERNYRSVIANNITPDK